MVFITGGIAAGKRSYAEALGISRAEIATCETPDVIPEADAICDVQKLVSGTETPEALEALACVLESKRVVIATEVGAGVVPLNAQERAWREVAGRLSCRLAQHANCVVRMCCGIPQVLKGSAPECGSLSASSTCAAPDGAQSN